MKASQLFFPTLREAPKEAELISHQLLLRGGYIRSLAAGVYSYLPLGWKVHEKIAQIVREEINDFGGQEIHMPVLIPKELLDESGRSSVPVLFRLKDRNERDFILGFTHEEVVTDIARSAVSSWRQMPLYLYQIQTKERDEPRPRGGLIRGREFTMFDGYSFDSSEANLDKIYRANYRAYERIFQRCGVDYLAVEADPGAIGGSENHEFMILTESGEDTVLRSDIGTYAANAERAEIAYTPREVIITETEAAQVVATPGAHTIDEVSAFLKVSPVALIKTIVCMADGKPVIALVRGDRELNLPKFTRAIGATAAELADVATVMRVTGAPVGFAGPMALKENVPIYVDNELNTGTGYIVGANEADAHRIHVAAGRDFTPTGWGDLRTAVAGDPDPRMEGAKLVEARGIEVGHIFKLGTKYSAAMKAEYTDENGKNHPILMGCYGLGVSRTMAAAVEAHHDENGIVWPISIAPYEAAVFAANWKEETQVDTAKELYRELRAKGADVLLDDRQERLGVKFKDLELIGLPIMVVVGKGLAEGFVEIGLRRVKAERENVPVAEAAQYVLNLIESEKALLHPGV